MAGDSSLPVPVVNLDASPVFTLNRYMSDPPPPVPSRVFRSELNASTRLPEMEGCRSLAEFRVRLARLEPSGCIA